MTRRIIFLDVMFTLFVFLLMIQLLLAIVRTVDFLLYYCGY